MNKIIKIIVNWILCIISFLLIIYIHIFLNRIMGYQTSEEVIAIPLFAIAGFFFGGAFSFINSIDNAETDHLHIWLYSIVGGLIIFTSIPLSIFYAKRIKMRLMKSILFVMCSSLMLSLVFFNSIAVVDKIVYGTPANYFIGNIHVASYTSILLLIPALLLSAFNLIVNGKQ